MVSRFSETYSFTLRSIMIRMSKFESSFSKSKLSLLNLVRKSIDSIYQPQKFGLKTKTISSKTSCLCQLNSVIQSKSFQRSKMVYNLPWSGSAILSDFSLKQLLILITTTLRKILSKFPFLTGSLVNSIRLLTNWWLFVKKRQKPMLRELYSTRRTLSLLTMYRIGGWLSLKLAVSLLSQCLLNQTELSFVIDTSDSSSID